MGGEVGASIPTLDELQSMDTQNTVKLLPGMSVLALWKLCGVESYQKPVSGAIQATRRTYTAPVAGFCQTVCVWMFVP